MSFAASIFDLFNDLCLATGIRPTGIKENTILVFGRTRAQELCESRGRRNSPDGLCEEDLSEWGFTANEGASTIHEDSTAYMISTSSLTIIISFKKLSPKYLRFQLPSSLKPVLNWANVCSPEHTSDTSTNYDSFLN